MPLGGQQRELFLISRLGCGAVCRNPAYLYSAAIQPGDKVLIHGGVLGEPLLKAVYVQVLQAG